MFSSKIVRFETHQSPTLAHVRASSVLFVMVWLYHSAKASVNASLVSKHSGIMSLVGLAVVGEGVVGEGVVGDFVGADVVKMLGMASSEELEAITFAVGATEGATVAVVGLSS